MGSLDKSSASSFVYAKASGLLAKSFIGKNAENLFSSRSLRELFTLLFNEEIPSIPEVMLAKEIEIKAEEKFLNQFKNLLNEYTFPSPILTEILSFYEYENSENKNNDEDRKHIISLWNSISSLKGSDRENLEKLFKLNFSLKNIIWLLRLKIYYHFSKEEILERLFYLNEEKKKDDLMAKEAILIIDKDPASYDDWKNWKYSEFLNPHEEGVIWEIDLCWLEHALKNYLAKSYLKFFHKDPMSITSLVSWFRIKEYELSCIRTVAEGLHLGIESDQMKDISGLN